MLCGLHHIRRVGHSAHGVDHSSWQVHRILYIGFYKKLKNVSCEYIRFLEIKKCFSSGGVVGAAEFRVFCNAGRARPSIRVRSCRMWFNFR